MSGSADHRCQIGHKADAATIYSKAFMGATTHNFAGAPSDSASLAKSKHGESLTTVKLGKNVKTGTYHVGGRCGGGNFGSATLKVATKASSSQSPGWYSLERARCSVTPCSENGAGQRTKTKLPLCQWCQNSK